MNWLAIATLALGFIAFAFSQQMASKTFSSKVTRLLLCSAVLLALPALIYAIYYLNVLGEPIWLYRLRTVKGSELLASFAGLLAGWAQVRAIPHLSAGRLVKKCLIPILLGIGLSVPHLKPLLRHLPAEAIPDQWRGMACIQSTASTCGPAAAATIVRYLGKSASEREFAAEAFTSATGTENWYLARVLREKGMRTSFVFDSPRSVALPAIAGVRLKRLGNSGHFVALLNRMGDQLILSDPMHGLSTNTIADLQTDYEFTGFFLVIQAP
jgi:hypothetical protein